MWVILDKLILYPIIVKTKADDRYWLYIIIFMIKQLEARYSMVPTISMPEIYSYRDEAWLESRLRNIQGAYFPDIVDEGRNVVIGYNNLGRKLLGAIKLLPSGKSLITMNSLVKDPRVPVEVIDRVIAHELVHYVDGFGSERIRSYSDPHRNGVVTKELRKRGFSRPELQFVEKWKENNWYHLYDDVYIRRYFRISK